MFRSTIALMGALAVGLAGCSASIGPPGAATNEEQTRRAAVAAQAQYPKDKKAQTDVNLTALVNQNNQTIRLVNGTDQLIRDAKVWVNGAYVANIDRIPPHGIATLKFSDFYDTGGMSLAGQNAGIRNVEIDAEQGFYRVSNPTFE